MNVGSKFFISHICFHRKCNVILKCVTVFYSYLYNHGTFLQVIFLLCLSLLYHKIFFMQCFFIKNFMSQLNLTQQKRHPSAALSPHTSPLSKHFLCTSNNIIHLPHPQHLIIRFQLLRHTSCFSFIKCSIS